jgi:uncharacterized hydrophobic protein (TIGR00271 family)
MDQPSAPDPHFQRGVKSFRLYLRDLFKINDIATPQETMEGIRKDVVFKGFNVWILIAAIFTASIGLNVNSTAVIIGAMLISPLMGPILGVGLSVGINDIKLLKYSAKNLGIAVAVSVITATLYFLITPLPDARSELLARTQPTLLDALIAFFGGAAGILAGSRREKSNVVPGVAIATALMPPLCTAGYGLAQGNMAYFLGAFYLFLINAVFISLATVLIVRYLKFPVVAELGARQQNIFRGASALVLLIFLVPAGWFLYEGARESLFQRRASQFVQEVCLADGAILLKSDFKYNRKGNEIQLIFVGNNLDENQIADWNKTMPRYQLNNTTLRVLQGAGPALQQGQSLDNQRYLALLATKNEQMVRKEALIDSLKKVVEGYRKRDFQYQQLLEEIKIQEPRLSGVSLGYMYYSNFQNLDSIPTVEFHWNKAASLAEQNKESKQLAAWMKVRLRLDTLAYYNH